MQYKIIYHVGNDISVKTKAESGTLALDSDSIQISGPKPLAIPVSSLREVELFRLHGLGRMIKLTCAEQTLFLTVVRLNLFGYFVIINFFKAGSRTDLFT